MHASMPNETTSYEGVIHRILHDRILLKFSNVFHERYNGESYRIIFKASRSNLKKQHTANNLIDKRINKDFLFPLKIGSTSDLQLAVTLDADGNLRHGNKTIRFFNPLLNIVQRSAVQRILKGEAQRLPYVIFGPPGE